MKVYVVQDDERNVIGVYDNRTDFTLGKATGIKILEFTVNDLHQVGDNDRPWCVSFPNADTDRPDIWPLIGFPEPSGPKTHIDGIEYVVYAINSCQALLQVFETLRFDSWEIAVADWEAMQ